jgi:hypothetical protein
MNTAAAVADFRTYPLISALSGVQSLADRVAIEWADGRVSPFHHVWLRDNCPCPQCVYNVTREQVFEIVDAAEDLKPDSRTHRYRRLPAHRLAGRPSQPFRSGLVARTCLR